MSNLDVIRAWKDEKYRLSLSEAERALLPAHPAGLLELTDAQLTDVVGGIFGLGFYTEGPACRHTTDFSCKITKDGGPGCPKPRWSGILNPLFGG
jgi:mersacidin/lichenicidin family type 2 lantibiotic